MIPENWVEVSLRELLKSLQSGSRPRGGVKGIESGVPSLGGEHLNAVGGFDFTKIRFVPEAFAEHMNAGQIQPHDTLIVKDGATTGKTSYVGEDFPHPRAFVNEHVFICRSSPEINSRYLFWFLFSKEGNERIMENFQGSAQGGINTTFAANVLVPLAPLNEQRRIVEKLDELMGRLASARAKLERVPRLLAHFRRAVLSAACSGALTRDWREKNGDVEKQTLAVLTPHPESDSLPELPETWAWVSIKSACNVVTGNTPSKKEPLNFSDAETDCPFFKPTDLEAGRNVHQAREFITSLGEKSCRVLPPQTVAVTCIGATLGKTGFLTRRGATNQQINCILPAPAFEPFFSYFYCVSPYFQTRLWAESSSTTLPIINKGRFEQLEIPLPPLAEQLEIVRRVNELFALADSLDARFHAAKAFFDRLPAAILAKAFRGELAAQDERDESAGDLLERLRKSRDPKPDKSARSRRGAAKQLNLEMEG